MLYISDIDR